MTIFQAFGFDSGLYALSILLIIAFSAVAGVVYKSPGIFLLLESQSKSIRYSRSTPSSIDAERLPSGLEAVSAIGSASLHVAMPRGHSLVSDLQLLLQEHDHDIEQHEKMLLEQVAHRLHRIDDRIHAVVDGCRDE